MKPVEEHMPKTVGAWPSQEKRQSTAEGRRETGNETSNLTVRYGKIGIPAVAAALRYCDAGKNPAYAPVVPLANHRLMERAA
jgi:hypothetical protein